MIGYLLNEDGTIQNKVIVDPENIIFDECILEPYSKDLLIPKWNRESESWEEGGLEEQLLEKLEQLKQHYKFLNRSQVRAECLEIAEEVEQSNWLNFPEDYDDAEIIELKNQIKEIRTKGREFRKKVDEVKTFQELSDLCS